MAKQKFIKTKHIKFIVGMPLILAVQIIIAILIYA